MKQISQKKVILTVDNQKLSFEEIIFPEYDYMNPSKTMELCEIVGYFEKKMIKPEFDYIMMWTKLLDNPSW